MSIDSKIAQICDHRIFEEQVQIQSDLRTIPIPRTVASLSTVSLSINGYEITRDNPLNSWNVESNTNALGNKSKIIFTYPRKSLDDFYEISYSCPAGLCPKCEGLRILNDESYNILGKLNTVGNEDKLLQEVQKGIATDLGTNPFHNWLGTKLSSLIGSKVYNIDLLKSQILQEVGRFFEKYSDIQIQQGQYQQVLNREAFLQLLSVDVIPQTQIDTSYWTVEVLFQNRTGQTMLYEKSFEIPGPSNLL